MNTAFLLRAHDNARYNGSVRLLAMAEIRSVLGDDAAVEPLCVGGMEFLTFDATAGERTRLRQSPNCAGIFLLDGERMTPDKAEKRHALGGDMAYILKYSGKTNPDFTDTMLFLAEAYAHCPVVSVLDPCCARGTTCYAAADRGCDAFGVDTDKNDVAEAVRFTKKYLEYHRVKHKSSHVNLTVNGHVGGERDLFTYTAENAERRLGFIRGNTLDCASFFTRERFSVLAADLPYGIRHSAENGAYTLVKRAFPVWYALLDKGGVAVLAFNTYTTKRDDLAALVASLAPEAEILPVSVPHWVEQAVLRDILIIRK